MNFFGYRRNNGNFGIRNHVLVFPTVICAAEVARMISQSMPGTVTVTHSHGCGHLGAEKEHMIRVMAGFCSSPNIAGVLLVGLGCELITPELLAENLTRAGQRYKVLSIQAEGGTTRAVEKGKLLVQRLLAETADFTREAVDISELILGTKCGGSDTLSGLTANPALGAAADMLVAAGGVVILSETPELLGAEHVLARRAANKEVKKRIQDITSATEASIKSMGVDIRGSEPSPGNIEGGITTLEEKALGAILKGGTSPIRQVVNYAVKPSERGLVIMDSPAHDAVCNTGLIAAGAHLIVFTTGRGTPLGAPVVPVIKVSSNNDVFHHMKDNIDINAGGIVDGTESIQSVGEQIFSEIIKVASGQLARSEVLGHAEFAIHPIGPTV